MYSNTKETGLLLKKVPLFFLFFHQPKKKKKKKKNPFFIINQPYNTQSNWNKNKILSNPYSIHYCKKKKKINDNQLNDNQLNDNQLNDNQLNDFIEMLKNL